MCVPWLAVSFQVHFEALEVEGHHADAAIAQKCAEIGADLLVKPAPPTGFQQLLFGRNCWEMSAQLATPISVQMEGLSRANPAASRTA